MGVQFGNLGLATSNTYFVARDRGLLGVLLGNSLLVAFGLGAAFSGVVHFVIAARPGLAPIEGPLLALALVAVPLGLSQLLLQNLLLGIQQVRQYNMTDLGSRFLTLVLVVALIVRERVTPDSVFSVNLLLFAVSTLWCGLLLRPFLRDAVRVSLALLRDPAQLRRQGVPRRALRLPHAALGPAAGAALPRLAQRRALLDRGRARRHALPAPATIGVILFPRLAPIADRHQKWALTRRVTIGVLVGLVPLVAVRRSCSRGR